MEAGKDQGQFPQQEMAMSHAADYQKNINVASSYKIEVAVVKDHQNDTGVQVVHSPDADSKPQCENSALDCTACPDVPSTVLGAVGTDCSIRDRQPDALVHIHESMPLELKGDGFNVDPELGQKDDRVDKLEAGASPGKMIADGEKECRVCHLNLANYRECGEAMYLGCACKDDLAIAHRRCAEAWFKVKGNTICEICGVKARNVTGMEDKEFMNEYNARTPSRPTPPQSQSPRWWNRLPLFNFLVAIVIAGVMLPWIFHFHLFA
ncbi:hypothetical protein O6H91_09G091400 [Diphasiastrum complanatum]|uniref:Uncharacterized protein n=1 Tax=Diphasiastrum complanatum TaxID=34168 RepID=A0ACC2CS47_DIPCM|nr:hypothetical protein O6H91_09G091400 [Diphasiastrum complanatum]